nr:PREDICTED: calcium signal-modulating cyclophilin ligand-like [Bemisia tabaci]
MKMSSEEMREARRRKILENSESRLNKILKRSPEPVSEEKAEATKKIHSVNNEARSTFPLPASANEDVFRLKDETSEPSPYKFQKGKTGDSFNYLRKYFVILAVVVYLIVAQGGNKLPSKSIFTPFATLGIVKQSLIFRYKEPSSSLYLQILILYGVNAKLLLRLSRVLNILYDFFLDFCVYFFTFVLLHFISEALIFS